MSFLEQIKYNIERKKSFLNIKELSLEASFLQAKFKKEIKRYKKFAEKNAGFLTEIHTIYQGLYQYYESAFENQIIYKGKYTLANKFVNPDYEQKFYNLDKLLKASYYETGFGNKNNERIYSNTPATERLNEFLKAENNEDFYKYCENKKLMFRNIKYLEKSYFTYDQLLEFYGKQRELLSIFNNMEKYSSSINKITELINNKSTEHISTYDTINIRKLKDKLTPTPYHNLDNNLDYISLKGITDESIIINKASDHARELKKHMNSSIMAGAL